MAKIIAKYVGYFFVFVICFSILGSCWAACCCEDMGCDDMGCGCENMFGDSTSANTCDICGSYSTGYYYGGLDLCYSCYRSYSGYYYSPVIDISKHLK